MNKKIVIALGTVFVVVFCCVCTGVLLYLVNKEQEAFAPLAAACDGRPVPGTLAYTRGAPPRMSFFTRMAAGWSTSTGMVPTNQRAEGPADTALVACAPTPPSRHVIENCCFERTVVGIGVPGTETCYPRVRMSQTIVVHVASTGAVLAQREIIGPEPRTCDDWVGRKPTEGNFVAGEPDESHMASFFMDPEAPEALDAPSIEPVEIRRVVDGSVVDPPLPPKPTQ